METYRCIAWTPFTLMGKAGIAVLRNRSIVPTFVLPRRGQGIRALPQVGFFISQSLAQPQNPIFKGGHRVHRDWNIS